MLKTILGLNPLREGDLSDTALMRLRISSIFALLMTPIVTISDYIFKLETLPLPLKLTFILGSMALVIPFCFSRLASIFTRSKKNLDEWELKARKEAESFTYRALGIILVLIFLTLLTLDFRHDLKALTLSLDVFVKFIGNILLLALFLPVAYIAWTQKPLGD